MPTPDLCATLQVRCGSDRENQKYEWFVSFTLLMVQDVLAAHRGKEGWEKLMEEQLGFHHDLLSEWKQAEPGYFKNFGADIQRMVDKVVMARKQR